MDLNTKMRKILTCIYIPIILLLTACGPNPGNSIGEYYGEYTFILPFETTGSLWTGLLQFRAEYSFDEIEELIIAAGYDVVRYDFDGSIRLLISTVIQDGRRVFFVIHSNNDVQNPDDREHNYILDNWFVVPLHLMDLANVREHIVFKDFEYVANFYLEFGKGVVIDYEKQTINFQGRRFRGTGMVPTDVAIRFFEGVSGNNYLELTERYID